MSTATTSSAVQVRPTRIASASRVCSSTTCSDFQDAANLFLQLVSSRYEHASLILTSNLPFSGWGGVFGDQAVVAAMIDRVVHHADVLTLKGASYRLRNRGIDTLPSIRTQDTAD